NRNRARRIAGVSRGMEDQYGGDDCKCHGCASAGWRGAVVLPRAPERQKRFGNWAVHRRPDADNAALILLGELCTSAYWQPLQRSRGEWFAPTAESPAQPVFRERRGRWCGLCIRRTVCPGIE